MTLVVPGSFRLAWARHLIDRQRWEAAAISTPRRGFNSAITRFWSLAAPVYDIPALQRFVYRPPQDRIIALLRADGSRRIADIGCGTGILADRIQRELQPDQVYGVDRSDGMLAQARARSTTVQWLRGPAEQLPFDDGALDAVVSTSAFHFFDKPAALREFHRVLRPGGLTAVATFAPQQLLPLANLSPVDNPGPAQLRELFEAAGFSVVEQQRVRRPLWPAVLSDMVTVGRK